MREEVVRYLVMDPRGFYLDATFGNGGHSLAILEATAADALVLALDRDEQAIAAGRSTFRDDARILLRHRNFSLMEEELKKIDRPLCGVLMDLGLSSSQLDDAARGFSFAREGPLDMRMDRTQAGTAARFLAEASETGLAACLRDYGEEPYARKIAALIIKKRDGNALRTTRDLLEAIVVAVPLSRLRKRRAAARAFQAIRISVNDEMNELKRGLRRAAQLLNPGGRLVVIAFHSLEHREVKSLMRSAETFGDGNKKGRMKPILSSLKPNRAEIARNTRARSGVMRVLEKVRH